MTKVHVRKHARNLKPWEVTKVMPPVQAKIISERSQPGVDMAEERIWKVRFSDGQEGTITRVDVDSQTGEEEWYADFDDANDYQGDLPGLLNRYPELRAPFTKWLPKVGTSRSDASWDFVSAGGK